MGRSIQFESEIELAATFENEVDDDVLEFYDQPTRLQLTIESDGKSRNVRYVPDFFEVRRSSAGFLECKREAEVAQKPELFIRTPEGRWVSPPAQDVASRLGFYHRLKLDTDVNPTFVRNVIFLRSYLQSSYPVDPRDRASLTSLVDGEPGLTLADLFRLTPARIARDAVFSLVAERVLYVDWNSTWIGDFTETRVFSSPQAARAYALVPAPARAAGRSEVHSSATETSPGSASRQRADDAFEVYKRASPHEREIAFERHAIISQYLETKTIPQGVTRRTLFRWLASARYARERYGVAFLGLLPDLQKRGNRNQMDPAVRALVEDVITERYKTPKRRSIHSVYGDLKLRCERLGLEAPSERTFARHVRRHSHYDRAHAREGAKVAYQYKEYVHEGAPPAPRHGDRPWEVVHVDHTELDILLVSSRTRQPLGRPWATYLMDSFSRRILALHLSFDVPSYRSCMMVLRECVRRFELFPELIWTDGGAEFRSTYFEQLLAAFECSKKTRPRESQRFGSILERLIGRTNTEFLYDLAGNTQSTKAVRQMTRAVDPRTHAVWTIADLHEVLTQWAYEEYDTQPHSELGCSPRDAFEQAVREHGERSHRRVACDDLFRILCLPSTPKGEATVAAGKGVLINYHYYWSSAFKNPRVEGTKVPVRYDPEDMSIAWAFVDGQWVKCLARLPDYLRGASEKTVRIVSRELKRQRARHGGARAQTAMQRAARVEELERREEILRQRLKDEETRAIAKTDRRSERNPEKGPSPRGAQSRPRKAKIKVSEVPIIKEL